MSVKGFERKAPDIQWCPGCGNFGILRILRETLEDMALQPQETVIVSGIGQAAKLPHYLNVHTFHSLHGRALSIATGVKAANPGLTVIAEGGDGDMYGEGGNHFIHTIRRNPDITNIVHNNMVYGLTKGQASPTSERGFKTPVQTRGVTSAPLNPLAMAIAAGATFVARTFAGDVDHAKDVIRRAIEHKGYALVDIFQPCVVFNRVNTYQWFQEHVAKLASDYDASDRMAALAAAFSADPLYIGVFLDVEEGVIFEESQPVYRKEQTPLLFRDRSGDNIRQLLVSYSS